MIGAISDIGNFRDVNEDFYDYEITDEYELYIVADGMGGHSAGDVASKICVMKIKEYIQDNFNKFDVSEMLYNAVRYANTEVYSKSLNEKKYNGMGTTLTFAYVIKNKIYVLNVGDSCFFVVNDHEITKITKDHSLVQQFIDSGILTQKEAKNHPNKNIITRSIGVEKKVDVDLFIVELDEDAFYLLCTDGLIRDIRYDEIIPYITKNKNFLSKACEELVDLAKERGGRDNISLIIFGGTSNDR